MVGYRGGHIEEDLLQKLNIPSLTLEMLGCPKYDVFRIGFQDLLPSCGFHQDNFSIFCVIIDFREMWVGSRRTPEQKIKTWQSKASTFPNPRSSSPPPLFPSSSPRCYHRSREFVTACDRHLGIRRRLIKSYLLYPHCPPITSCLPGTPHPPPTHQKNHVTLSYLNEADAAHSQFNMASRQSLRLQGMGPEVPPFQDKCFICLLHLDIQTILHCHAMRCCGKFLHRRCFRKAHSESFQCGHCRRYEHDSDTTDSLDTLRANETVDNSLV